MTQKHKGRCKYCGGIIPKERGRQSLYCSDKCQRQNYGDQWHALNPTPKLHSNTVGVLSEYRVAVDLLTKGYEIFRSINPHCSCDLAVLKDGKLFRVEVTTGRYSVTGKIVAPLHDEAKYDILATVLHDKIQYEPDLPIDS